MNKKEKESFDDGYMIATKFIEKGLMRYYGTAYNTTLYFVGDCIEDYLVSRYDPTFDYFFCGCYKAINDRKNIK